jgi:hypothetical protein
MTRYSFPLPLFLYGSIRSMKNYWITCQISKGDGKLTRQQVRQRFGPEDSEKERSCYRVG